MLKSMVRLAAPVNGISVMVRMLVTTTVWLSPFLMRLLGSDLTSRLHVILVSSTLTVTGCTLGSMSDSDAGLACVSVMVYSPLSP